MAQHQEVSSSDTESDSSKSGNETLIDISVSEFVLVTLGVVLRWFHSTSQYSVLDSHIFRSWGQWSGNETKHTVYTLRVASFPGSPGTRIYIAWRAWYLSYVSMT